MFVYACVCVSVCVCMHVCICVLCLYVCVYACVYVCMCVCRRPDSHPHYIQTGQLPSKRFPIGKCNKLRNTVHIKNVHLPEWFPHKKTLED